MCKTLSNCELCHSTLKPIDDEEDTLKSFMAFNITPRGHVFRVVVGIQIVIPPTTHKGVWEMDNACRIQK